MSEKIKAIVLASTPGGKRCPLVASLPVALWPVDGESTIQRLLVHLLKHGIGKAVICSNGDAEIISAAIDRSTCPEIEFNEEHLPVGPAGCIKIAADVETDEIFVVIQADIISPPDISALIEEHIKTRSDLTVVCNPSKDGNMAGEPAGIYICRNTILEHIPEQGYFDIKEGLISALLRVGKTVKAVVLPKNAGNFRDRAEYIRAIAGYLAEDHGTSDNISIAADAVVDPSVRMSGPISILSGARIEKGAVILGPAVIGQNAVVGENSVVSSSVIWEDVEIGSQCYVNGSVIARGAMLAPDVSVEQESVVGVGDNRIMQNKNSKTVKSLKSDQMKVSSASSEAKVQPFILQNWQKLSVALAVVVAFVWCYWQGIKDVWILCTRSDEFSAGLLVPFIAVYVLWSRRERLLDTAIRPAFLCGTAALICAQAVRVAGTYYMYSSLERFSIVLTVAALVLLIFGWQISRKVFTVLLFLLLMLPWPNQVQSRITQPLQSWATTSAVFCLETAGADVVRQGNIISLGDTTVAVAEACNGLRMITAFFVIIGLVVLIVDRPWWEKMLVFLSCLPIALVCNTIRLVVTTLAFTVLEGPQWEEMFHDYGGYAMMPLALIITVGELWLIKKLTTEPVEEEEIIITRNKTA